MTDQTKRQPDRWFTFAWDLLAEYHKAYRHSYKTSSVAGAVVADFVQIQAAQGAAHAIAVAAVANILDQFINERDVIDWQRERFPNATPASVLAHMEEEVSELRMSIHIGSETSDGYANLRGEIGDLGLLLVAMAQYFNTTLNACMVEKFAIARQRKYAYRADLGYSKHVEDEGSEPE